MNKNRKDFEDIAFAICVVLGLLAIVTILYCASIQNIDTVVVEFTTAPTVVEATMPEPTETAAPTIETTVPETTVAETEPVVTETVPETTERIVPVAQVITYEKSIEFEGVAYNIGKPTTELEMLAMIIYQESGGDASCDTCRRRVGDVVLNRVNSPRFPNTMKEVLLQRGQYGELHWTGLKWKDRASHSGEAHAVARAYRIAQELLDGQHSDVYGDYIWQAGFHQGHDEIYHCGHYFGK